MTVTLTKPGDEVTLTVQTVERVESTAKKGTYRYQIDGVTPTGQAERTYANEEALLRELKHKGFADAAALQGNTIRFWRKAAPNNTPAAGYLNIDVLTPADFKAAAPSKRLTGPDAVPGDAPARYRDVPPPSDEDAPLFEGPEDDGPFAAPSIAEQKQEKIERAYARAWEASRRAQNGVGTPDSIQAGAATIIIQFEKAGLLR